jgi:LPXTG-site transpeptidase (sortase) family protein
LATVVFLSAFHLLPSEFSSEGSELGIFERTKLALLGVDVPAKANVPVVTSSAPKANVNVIDAENPIRIVIAKAGVDINVRNPESTNPDFLDTELTRGVVRYPGSGMPGAGNMFIFGHSTGLSAVQNQAYKAFNEIHNLVVGDIITIYSTNHIYTYKVQVVKKVDKNDTWVRFDGSRTMLTLSTCDSFGSKADRYVVEAEYVGITQIKG